MVLYHHLFESLVGLVVKKTYSVVDLATRYGLDGLGFDSCKEKRLFFNPNLSTPALGYTQPNIQWVPGFLPEDKAAEA